MVFATCIHFYSIQKIAGKAGVEPLTGLHCNQRLKALPANIRLEWKLMQVANTLARELLLKGKFQYS